MIRTITLNSGFDEVYTISGFEFGKVGNVIRHDTLASGKGLNAARVIATLGEEVTAYGFVGSSDYDEFSSRLKADGVAHRLVKVHGRTRRNLTVLDEASGLPTAHFKGSGFEITSGEAFQELLDLLGNETKPGDIVTLNGSTPRGLAVDCWARCGQVAIARGATLLVDIHGEPLRHLIGSCEVFLCKPNEDEVSVLCDGTVSSHPYAMLRFMALHKVTLPVVTLGERGILFMKAGEIRTARCTVENARMLVGAGDACLAGFAVAISQHGNDVETIVRFGVATASAYVMNSIPGKLASLVRELLPRVTIESSAED